MAERQMVPDAPPAAALPPVLPAFPSLFHAIEGRLAAGGHMGLLYATVLQHRAVEHSSGWQAYEAMMREIGACFEDFRSRRMRSADLLLEPSTQGGGRGGRAGRGARRVA